MKILITGGAGFIASNIADSYISDGHEVVIVDNLSSGKLSNLNPKAKFYEIDIRSPKISDIFEKERPDLVNHHAAQIDVRKSVADPIEDAEINIIGTINMLQNSAKYGVKRFLFASSGGVAYGEPEYLPADLKHRINPLSPYGASKMSVEYYLKIYSVLHGISYAAMRYGNVYGPRQDPHGEAGVVAIFANRVLENEPFFIFGDGEQVRDYIFVGDVVTANRALSSIELSGSFNIGTGIGSSVNKLHEIYCKIVGHEIEKIYKPPRAGELNKIYLKHDGKLFGWKPTIELEDGLTTTFNYFKSEKNKSAGLKEQKV